MNTVTLIFITKKEHLTKERARKQSKLKKKKLNILLFKHEQIQLIRFILLNNYLSFNKAMKVVRRF